MPLPIQPNGQQHFQLHLTQAAHRKQILKPISPNGFLKNEKIAFNSRGRPGISTTRQRRIQRTNHNQIPHAKSKRDFRNTRKPVNLLKNLRFAIPYLLSPSPSPLVARTRLNTEKYTLLTAAHLPPSGNVSKNLPKYSKLDGNRTSNSALWMNQRPTSIYVGRLIVQRAGSQGGLLGEERARDGVTRMGMGIAEGLVEGWGWMAWW
ncbi:hypothetical protein K458DRAFT_407195 [Lentithecium fluviatile CBS 122367]|uniref:Uncharacterized protein n=1 Tax=Lentithecium fluviatile CBS 122367 TaxID=1168545 RepID=A0A6G1IQK5_9PLEO|nr:hypothetical protein K458DRAFT_407195 [Lentithecium fluviatile CBS 122367]